MLSTAQNGVLTAVWSKGSTHSCSNIFLQFFLGQVLSGALMLAYLLMLIVKGKEYD